MVDDDNPKATATDDNTPDYSYTPASDWSGKRPCKLIIAIHSSPVRLKRMGFSWNFLKTLNEYLPPIRKVLHSSRCTPVSDMYTKDTLQSP